MIKVIILIGLLIVSVVLIILIVKHKLFMNDLYWHFENMNVIVFGKKGTGKDLTFNKVINHRKQFYYSNLPYSENPDNYEILNNLNEVSCMPNTYENIVNGNISPQPHRFKESCDIYISDIGIYLPSYMDNKLYNKFPSMPILYALSRHLYDNNIHCNTQNLERGWKAIREQADFYVKCCRTYHLPFILVTKVIVYDKYDSAKRGLEPVKARLLNKYSKAEIDLYNAENGDIRKGHIIQLKKNIHYDTRYFEKILLTGDRLY